MSSYNLSESVPFTTDNNMYTVDSVELVISRLFGNTSDLTLSLYSDAGDAGSSLGTFSNPANITQGGALYRNCELRSRPTQRIGLLSGPGRIRKIGYLNGGTALQLALAASVNSIQTRMLGARGLSAQLINSPRLWFMAHRCRSHQPSPCLALVPSLLVFCSVGTPDSLFLRISLSNYWSEKPVSYQYQKRTWPVV